MDKIIVDNEIAYKYIDNGNYYITKTGILYSIFTKGAQGRTDINNPRKVAYGKDRDGYYRVVLSDNGNRKYIKVHQIVARQFIGECPDGFVVNHIDGDKHNNSVENLEYITAVDNVLHAWNTGLNSKDKNSNRIPVDILDNETGNLYHFSSIENAGCVFDGVSKRYIRNIRDNKVSFGMCMFKKVVTGKSPSDYFIECYYNGMLYKTFSNTCEAGKYFGHPQNSVSGSYKTLRRHKINRYTITFPNVSTIESVA